MKRRFFVTICVLLLLSCDDRSNSRSLEIASDMVKVLFVGKSYTFNNELPNQVKAMAIENSDFSAVETKSLAPGAAKLKDHLRSSFTIDTIRDGQWNVVVLQVQVPRYFYSKHGHLQMDLTLPFMEAIYLHVQYIHRYSIEIR